MRGRTSTQPSWAQDPEASRNWQLARAKALVDKHGEIVTEFFDVGQSRSIPWKRRPELIYNPTLKFATDLQLE